MTDTHADTHANDHEPEYQGIPLTWAPRIGAEEPEEVEGEE